jgi:hypothetical protein
MLAGSLNGSAQQNISYLSQQLKNTPSETMRLRLYKEIGAYYEARQMDSAVYYISEGLRAAEQLRDTSSFLKLSVFKIRNIKILQ